MPEEKARKATAKKVTAAVAWENPLIPNKKLRALYVAMVELRLIDANIHARSRSSARLKTVRGEEGCRVSTTIDLKPGDLTSDGPAGSAVGLLRGAKLASLLPRAADAGSNKTAAGEDPTSGQLPMMAIAVDRLHLAMGAAFALKTARRSAILIAYVSSNEVKLAEWKPLLRFAAVQVMPVIFVVLPGPPETKPTIKPGQLSLASSKCGVPGIPVDAADPVALYRVAQESLLRARAGGGPVLMECIAFQVAGTMAAQSDPVATMREFLLHRKIVDDAWLQRVETRFQMRLKALGKQG